MHASDYYRIERMIIFEHKHSNMIYSRCLLSICIRHMEFGCLFVFLQMCTHIDAKYTRTQLFIFFIAFTKFIATIGFAVSHSV